MVPFWDALFTALVWTCWGAFLLVWAVGAVHNALHGPSAQQRRGWFSPWLIGIALIVAGMSLVPQRLWDTLTFDATPLRVIGAAVLVVSTLFTLWARLTLGTMWTSSPVIKQDHELRTTGPYAVTRHPIYTGVLGMLTGTMLISGVGVWLLYVLVGGVVLKTKVSSEERLLQEAFGERYREYQQRVPQLMPRL
jgi:protein-S-isoprenylcysteine O-methyltransferase Ste14